mgnify:FL=1
MKTNSTKQSLTRKVAAKIVFVLSFLIIFPMVVFAGIIDKFSNKVKAHKVTANTSVNSDESKIPPKNTKNVSNRGEAIGEEFNFTPDRSVRK